MLRACFRRWKVRGGLKQLKRTPNLSKHICGTKRFLKGGFFLNFTFLMRGEKRAKAEYPPKKRGDWIGRHCKERAAISHCGRKEVRGRIRGNKNNSSRSRRRRKQHSQPLEEAERQRRSLDGVQHRPPAPEHPGRIDNQGSHRKKRHQGAWSRRLSGSRRQMR